MNSVLRTLPPRGAGGHLGSREQIQSDEQGDGHAEDGEVHFQTQSGRTGGLAKIGLWEPGWGPPINQSVAVALVSVTWVGDGLKSVLRIGLFLPRNFKRQLELWIVIRLGV
jgi:hypothetical protein